MRMPGASCGREPGREVKTGVAENARVEQAQRDSGTRRGGRGASGKGGEKRSRDGPGAGAPRPPSLQNMAGECRTQRLRSPLAEPQFPIQQKALCTSRRSRQGTTPVTPCEEFSSGGLVLRLAGRSIAQMGLFPFFQPYSFHHRPRPLHGPLAAAVSRDEASDPSRSSGFLYRPESDTVSTTVLGGAFLFGCPEAVSCANRVGASYAGSSSTPPKRHATRDLR